MKFNEKESTGYLLIPGEKNPSYRLKEERAQTDERFAENRLDGADQCYIVGVRRTKGEKEREEESFKKRICQTNS